MAKALYNPRFFTAGSKKTVNTQNIERFMWSHAAWFLKVNEVKKFPDEVGEALLRHYEFLIEVTPKNIAEVKKMMDDKQYKCDQCEFQTDTKLALAGHKRSHGVSDETSKMLEELEDATPKGAYQKTEKPKLTPEQIEGIPQGEGRDKDGIEFYGAGLEDDAPKGGQFRG